MALIFLLGRIIFGGFFLENAYNHFKHTDRLAEGAAGKGVSHPRLAVQGSGALLLVGGLSMISGHWPGIGLIAIVMFLGPVTFMMHAYWKETDPGIRARQKTQFLKNMALLGAALMMAALPGPWPYSI